jgi:Zn-dependent protease
MDTNQALLNIAIGVPGFLVAIVFHEAGHAWVASLFGDDTAKRMGRLTLNPFAHFTLFGTVLMPLIGALAGGIMFGWAKPVPINPLKFKKIRAGIFWVSFAGPGINILLGIFSAFLLALFALKTPQDFYLYTPILEILRSSVYVNFILAGFNLIPLPPLDGSKLVQYFMDIKTAIKFEELSQYSFYILLALILLDSFARINIIGFLLTPAVAAAQFSIQGFVGLLA